MKNFTITWKTLPIAILIVAGIFFKAGLKVWDEMPGYRTIYSGIAVIPHGKAWMYSVKANKTTKIRISGDIGSHAMNVYLADRGTHNMIEQGKLGDMNALRFVLKGGGQVHEREVDIASGEHFIYFEPVNADSDVQLKYKIEGYQK